MSVKGIIMGNGKSVNMISGSICGMFLCLISSFTLSLGTLMVAHMQNYHPITKSFWRFLFTFLPAIFVVAYYVIRDRKVLSILWPVHTKDGFKVHMSLLVRSVFGCSAGTLQYYSLKYIPLGDSSVICNSYPVFVSILARIFLGEPFGIFMFLSTAVTFLGVAVVTQPPFLTGIELNMNQVIGASLACACSLALAVAIVMIRHLKKIHHSLTLVFFAGYGTIETFIMTLGFGVLEFPPLELNNIEIYMAVAIGILSCISQMFLIFALKCDNAGPISLVKSTDVIFAFIWQFIFFRQNPTMWSLIGGLIMMMGIGMAGFRRYLDSLPESHTHRKHLWFILK